MQQPYLSIIIPAYNEAKRIIPSLEKICKYLDERKTTYELLVIDDGSTDGTPDLVRKLANDHEAIRVISNETNEGKGASVKRGVINSWGEIVYFTDADLSTPIEEIEKFLPLFPAFDVVIGSRSIEGADVKIHEPLFREILGKVFNKFVQFLCVPGIIDTQCGAKMFRKDPAQMIFPLIQTARFSFDVEVLFVAKKLGYTIKEIPIRWYYSDNTTVRTFSDGPQMLLDLFKIRWIHKNLRQR